MVIYTICHSLFMIIIFLYYMLTPDWFGPVYKLLLGLDIHFVHNPVQVPKHGNCNNKVTLHSRRCRLAVQCTKIPPELKVPSSSFGGCSVCLNFPLICIDAPLNNSYDTVRWLWWKGASSAFITFTSDRIANITSSFLYIHNVPLSYALLHIFSIRSPWHSTKRNFLFLCFSLLLF